MLMVHFIQTQQNNNFPYKVYCDILIFDRIHIAILNCDSNTHLTFINKHILFYIIYYTFSVKICVESEDMMKTEAK